MSRRENVHKSFDGLRTAIAQELHVKNAILDGEIVVLDALGRSQFKQLLFRRGNPCFYASERVSRADEMDERWRTPFILNWILLRPTA